jgi:hypothetical protein
MSCSYLANFSSWQFNVDYLLFSVQSSLQECALLTDGRFSGGSHGFVVGHICPEAQVLYCTSKPMVAVQWDLCNSLLNSHQ